MRHTSCQSELSESQPGLSGLFTGLAIAATAEATEVGRFRHAGSETAEPQNPGTSEPRNLFSAFVLSP